RGRRTRRAPGSCHRRRRDVVHAAAHGSVRGHRSGKEMTAAFFQGKSVLITGASSGIGEELAWQRGQAGAHLTLTARRADLLDALAQRIATAGTPQPIVVRCDVTRD